MTQQLITNSSSIQVVNAYTEYQAEQGLPVITGFAVENVFDVDLAPWPKRGGKGIFINLDGTGGTNDAYLCEIPPGGTLNPMRHMYEEMVFVLDGSGATSVWYNPDKKVTFEWQRGSLFAIPLNANFQHFNGQGGRPARMFSVTNAPIVMSLFHNARFIFENEFTFDDRFGDEDRYFEAGGTLYKNRVLETNFVPDAYGITLYEWKERGAGGKNISFELSHNTMASHISEFPVGTYKKAHRHGPGAHVIILGGQGYSLLWPAGGEPKRVDWQPGSVVVPPSLWFHEHFNGGADPARYMALRWGSQRYRVTGGGLTGSEEGITVEEGGGTQIEYEHEDPKIHQMFEADLKASGALCRMKSMVPWCTGV